MRRKRQEALEYYCDLLRVINALELDGRRMIASALLRSAREIAADFHFTADEINNRRVLHELEAK